MMTQTNALKTYNNTGMDLKTVVKLPFLGRYKNEWRQIYIDLYRLDEGRVISVGTEFTGRVRNIVVESDQDHFRALDAFKHGRGYIAY